MALVMSDPKTLALGIEYRGTAFNGWQVQPDHPSVQAALEAALSQFADHPISVICAGRTDTGVHATHQVVSFSSAARRPSAGWIRGVNAILPESVAVRWMREVDEKFHARFSARSRTYEYWIWNDPVRSPLFEGSAGWVFRPLNEALMQRGAAALIGEHDFTSFRASECQAKTPVRTISELKIVAHWWAYALRPMPFCSTWCETSLARLFMWARGGKGQSGLPKCWLPNLVMQPRPPSVRLGSISPEWAIPSIRICLSFRQDLLAKSFE